MAVSAEDLYRRGVESANRGRYAQARRSLAEADRRTDDENLRARIAGTTAYVLGLTGDPEGAERLCRNALARPGLSPETAAILHGQLGALAMTSGRLGEAVAWLDRGIAALADAPVAAANMRTNRGLVNMQRRELTEAAADLEAALDAYRAAGEPSDIAEAQHNLGYVALLRGDLVRALREMSAARAVVESPSPVWTAISDVDRAVVLRDAGLTTEAERILERAARVFGAHGMAQFRAETEISLARSLLTHDPLAAHRVGGAAARRFRDIGNETGAARADGVRLRAALAERVIDRHGNPVPLVRRAPEPAVTAAAATTLDKMGFRSEAAALRLTAALRNVRHAVTGGVRVVRQPSDSPIDVSLLAQEVRAARAARAGRERDVRRAAAQGLEEFSAWQRSFGSVDLRTSAVALVQPLIVAGLDSALRSGDPEVLFDWSERARHMSLQVLPLRPPPDPELAAELSELRMIRSEHEGGDWLADPRASALRERARERQWVVTGTAAVEERVTLSDAQRVLDGRTAVLSYVWSASGMACVVVTPTSASIVPIDWPVVRAALEGLRADLDVSATVRAGPMAAVIRRAMDDRLATISAALLRRPAAAAGAQRLVITTPGVLSGIPWAMLPAMSGVTFTLAASVTRWVGERASGRPPATVGVAVGPRVPRGDEEADAVASVWRTAATLRDAAATVDAVTELASAVDVLHVAAHGRHSADNPMFSGLELADGALFGYDIDRIPHLPATVVLSACEVGRSSVRWGEEALGMTRTWLHAGTRCVIAAPVIVADDVACELLGAVHEGLAAGVAPAEALAEASSRTGLVAPFQCHGAGF